MGSRNRKPEVRANATPSPVNVPQTNPTADSTSVHCRPLSRNRSSPFPINASSLGGIIEVARSERVQDQHHEPRHREIEQRYRSIDLKTAERIGFDSLGD